MLLKLKILISPFKSTEILMTNGSQVYTTGRRLKSELTGRKAVDVIF